MTTTDTDGICRCGHPIEFHGRGECWTDLRRTGDEPWSPILRSGDGWNPVEQCECRTADPA